MFFLRNNHALLGSLLLILNAVSATAQPLQSKAGETLPSGIVALQPGVLTEVEEDEGEVDERDSDILNFSTGVPGVLVVETQSADVEGQGGVVTLSVDAGYFSLTVEPHAVATRPYRLQLRLLPVCELREGDDHGEGLMCATELEEGSPESGKVGGLTSSETDEDTFVFNLASATSVTLASSGTTDTFGRLYDDQGHLIADDDDSGSGDNFQIQQSLTAGRYVLWVSGALGATGNYGVSLTTTN